MAGEVVFEVHLFLGPPISNTLSSSEYSITTRAVSSALLESATPGQRPSPPPPHRQHSSLRCQ